MNGVHDLGGLENFGPVTIEENEPVFHADWEGKTVALMMTTLGAGYYCVDEVRRTTEHIPPAQYLGALYYEKWLCALESLLLEKNVVTREELEQGRSLRDDGFTLPPVPVEKLAWALGNPIPANVESDRAPVFSVGEKVRTRNRHPRSHTRMPAYARDKIGTIDTVQEVFRVPDCNAHGDHDTAEHVYNVRFEARTLWGEDAPAQDAVYLDMFESYLQPA